MNIGRVALAATIVATPALAQQHVSWDYSGPNGPKAWGSLDKSFAACSNGKSQSPVDLSGLIEAELPEIRFDYATPVREMFNNGHTLQVTYAAGSTISLDGQTFELKQMHFHAPSENRIQGKEFAFETHLVHASKKGDLAVVAVFHDIGAADALLGKLWARMPAKAGDTVRVSEPTSARSPASQHRLLQVRRVAHDAAVHGRRAVVGAQVTADDIAVAGERIRARHAPRDEQARTTTERAGGAQVVRGYHGAESRFA